MATGLEIPIIMAVAGAGMGAAQNQTQQKNAANAKKAQYLQGQHAGQMSSDRASEQAGQYNAQQMIANTAKIISAGANAGAQARAAQRQAGDAMERSSRRLADSVAMASLSAESRGVASGSGSNKLIKDQMNRRGAKEAATIQHNLDVTRENIWNQYSNVVDTAKYTSYRAPTTFTPTTPPSQSIDGFSVFASGFSGGVDGFVQGYQLKEMDFNFGGPTPPPPSGGD